jgi:hypothetical protein
MTFDPATYTGVPFKGVTHGQMMLTKVRTRIHPSQVQSNVNSSTSSTSLAKQYALYHHIHGVESTQSLKLHRQPFIPVLATI